MQRAATDVMEGIIFSAVIDAIGALRAASKGLPNNLLRDLQSVHPNTTFADLPRELQDSIRVSVRAAFSQLLKEGYSVGPRQQMQASRPLDRVPERDRRGAPPDRRPRGPGGPPRGEGDRRPDGRGPAGGRRPPRKPKGKPKLS